ncbi:FG-GAP-like repeat-containing protein [Streptomyces wuyuanensis]|uniref:FG-GAP-like repeat-containing protein n=1 Tax=Streptomyces wuyuanensis TaxID=1196353 RepID=UPI0037900010
MKRHAFIRTTLVAGLLIGSGGPLAGGAVAAEVPLPPHSVFQSDRYVPRGGSFEFAGEHGLLRREEGTSGLLWTDFAAGRTVPVGDLSSGSGVPGALGAGSDTMAVVQGGTVELRNLATGGSRTLTLPPAHTYLGTYGETVLTHAEGGSGGLVGALHLSRLADDGTVVTRPAAVGVGSVFHREVLAADARTVVLRYRDTAAEPDRDRFGLLSVGTGQFVPGPAIPDAGEISVALGQDRIAWYTPGQPIRFVSRATPAAAPSTVALPAGEGTVSLGLVGEWIVVARSAAHPTDMAHTSGMPLIAVRPGAGEPVKLLPHADGELLQVPGGDLLVTGGTDSAHWAVRRLTAPAGGGAPAFAEVTSVQPVPAKVERLSLANGTLATDEADGSFLSAFFTRSVTTEGATFKPGVNNWRQWTVSSVGGPWSAGDGRVVRMGSGLESVVVRSLDKDDEAGYFRTHSRNANLLDITGRYAVVNGSDPAEQYVGDLGVRTDLEPIRTRTTSAASVWGTTLWTQTTVAGSLQAEDLKSGVKSTLVTGAPCVAKELQAVGRWIYWSCGTAGPAGVWDRTGRKNIPVPTGEALVGDGYLVRHDKAKGKLLLTAFRGGTTVTRELGDLPGTAANRRGVTWTVDKFGGPAAYVAEDGKIHLAPSGVTTEPLSIIESEHVGHGTQYRGRLQLSRPGASWKLAIATGGGEVVRTLSGQAQNGTVRLAWDGKTNSGRYAPNGNYFWTLTVQPANGQGAPLTTYGATRLTQGAPVHRDHVASGGVFDSIGDLVTVDDSGALTFHQGFSDGLFRNQTTGEGWPKTALPVPFGDLNGDRCNDVLVRLGSELRAYRPRCMAAVTPKTPYTSLGKVWGQFNVLTSPGDMTGDGRPDLVARQATTGDIYLYADNGEGGLKARGRIGAKWTGFRAVFGGGDVTGDGIGDVLAVDKANSLWRYDGTAAGLLKPGVRVFAGNWAVGRNAFVGIGYLNGDKKPDLVSRKSTGELFFNSGNGAGSFGSTVRIGPGWQGYKGLF